MQVSVDEAAAMATAGTVRPRPVANLTRARSMPVNVQPVLGPTAHRQGESVSGSGQSTAERPSSARSELQVNWLSGESVVWIVFACRC